MSPPEREAQVAAALRRINHAWLNGHPDEIADLVHEDVVFLFPGFSASSAGREAFVTGFREFCSTARVQACEESDPQMHVVGATGVASVRFEMIYERADGRYRATGRDLWVFEERDGDWLAVWRTILDLSEEPVT